MSWQGRPDRGGRKLRGRGSLAAAARQARRPGCAPLSGPRRAACSLTLATARPRRPRRHWLALRGFHRREGGAWPRQTHIRPCRTRRNFVAARMAGWVRCLGKCRRGTRGEDGPPTRPGQGRLQRSSMTRPKKPRTDGLSINAWVRTITGPGTSLSPLHQRRTVRPLETWKSRAAPLALRPSFRWASRSSFPVIRREALRSPHSRPRTPPLPAQEPARCSS